MIKSYNNLLKLRISFLCILFFDVFFNFGCADKNLNQDNFKNALDPILDNTKASDRPLVFELLEPSLALNAVNILKRWNSKKYTNKGVHVFVHPESAKALKQFDDAGITTHAANEDELKNAWSDIMAKNKDRKKLIIFIKTHGDGISASSKGNFCYRNERSCTLDVDRLLKALQAISNMPNSSLKDVVVIPLSCFNKNIMDRFEEEAKKITWSFGLTVLSQAIKDECSSGAFAWSLEKKEFIINSQEHMNDKFIGTFFKAENLLDLISLYDPVFTGIPTNIYEIKHITKPENKLSLKDFGFHDLKLAFSFHCKFVDLSKPLDTILKSLGVESEGRRLSKISFISENTDIKINGNLSKIFDAKEYGGDPKNCLMKFVFSDEEE